MPWGEALALTRTLAADPSSRVAAAVAGWQRPTTFAEMALLNLFDLMHQAAWAQGGGKGARPKPHPRPWVVEGRKRMRPTISQERVIEALRMAGHTMPLPGEAQAV